MARTRTTTGSLEGAHTLCVSITSWGYRPCLSFLNFTTLPLSSSLRNLSPPLLTIHISPGSCRAKAPTRGENEPQRALTQTGPWSHPCTASSSCSSYHRHQQTACCWVGWRPVERPPGVERCCSGCARRRRAQQHLVLLGYPKTERERRGPAFGVISTISRMNTRCLAMIIIVHSPLCDLVAHENGEQKSKGR